MATITKMQPRPNTYRIDNIILDDYGEKIGAIGIAVYNALARYADRQTGDCYPCKPCHDILSVSGYFRRLNADTRRTMCLSLRQERQQVYTGCDKHGFSTHNTLFFLVLCLNDNFLPISEALCKSSEVK